MTPPPFLPHYIHGQRVAKSDGETFISSNPATGEPIFEVEHATKTHSKERLTPRRRTNFLGKSHSC